MNWEKFEDAGHARSPFPLTSFLSLRERRNHSAPWAQSKGVGGCLVPAPAWQPKLADHELATAQQGETTDYTD